MRPEISGIFIVWKNFPSTLAMKWIHWLVLNPVGRLISDAVLKTRVLRI